MKNKYLIFSLVPDCIGNIYDNVGFVNLFEAENPIRAVSQLFTLYPSYKGNTFFECNDNQYIDDFFIEHEFIKMFDSCDLIPVGYILRKNETQIVDDILVLYTTSHNNLLR